MDIRVGGEKGWFKFAAALHHAGRTDLSAELNRSLRTAAGIVIREIERTTDDYMPSGYERAFAASLKLKPEIRLVSSHRATIVGVGVSRAKGRDVERLNEGILRKPVFGRYRTIKHTRTTKSGRSLTAGSAYKNPWAPQRIRVGWFSEPFERSRPAVLAEFDAAVARVAKKIERA